MALEGGSRRGVPFRAHQARAALVLVPALLLVLLMLGANAQSADAAARNCTAPKYPGSGYFTSLNVTNASCSQGSKVAKAYYTCRTKRSKSGRCTSKVLGYRCSETRNAIPTELNARVTCRKGRAKVVHTYQQNL